MKQTLQTFFHETLAEQYSGCLCPFCGDRPWKNLAHNEAQSEANIKIFGDIIDAPMVNVMPSCAPCNNDYKRKIIYTDTLPVIFGAGVEAWKRYVQYRIKHPRLTKW